MMTKACLLALATSLGVALPAAAHTPRHRLHRHDLAAISPIRPLTAPARPKDRVAPAPMPDQAVTAPIDRSDQTTSLAPAVMQIHYPPQGDGYVSGSSAQAMDDREAAKVTGVLLRMPLGQ